MAPWYRPSLEDCPKSTAITAHEEQVLDHWDPTMITAPRTFVPILFVLLALPVLFVLLALNVSAAADTLVRCPDLAGAKRVGNCPSKADLKHYFKRTCLETGDDQFRGASLLYCDTLADFVKAKDIAMWEAETDAGVFANYMTCGLGAGEIPASKSKTIQVECSSRSCSVHCGYENDLYLTLRPMQNCRFDGNKSKLGLVETECGPGKADCVARCN